MAFHKSVTREMFSVRVQTMDAELEFSLDHKATGRDLFELVCRTIGLREVWYFGLQFTNSEGYCAWLTMEKQVLKQGVQKSDAPYQFLFMAKFFPEEVTDELIQDVTQHLFFLQVKQAILSMDIYCPPEASVLLASYAVQAKYGDFDKSLYKPEMLLLEDLLPQRVVDQFQMTAEMWEDRIKTWWMNNKGMAKEEAELEYLRIAQDLDMYGTSYFPIYNKKHSELWLGVSPLSLNVYTKDNKLNATTVFLWSEIRNISFKDKKFIIKTSTKDSEKGRDFVFFSENLNVNKLILDLSVGNHNLWLKRRQADSMEVQQMKMQAKEERSRRQAEKRRLEHELNTRLLLEKERDRLREQVSHLQEQFDASQEALRRSEETADLLAEKARISEEEALVLAKRASEAEAEIQRLRISTIKTEEEKILLERKAREAELKATRVVEESSKKAREADRLKEDLLRARQAERLARDRLCEVMGTPYLPMQNGYDFAGGMHSAYLPVPSSYGNVTAFDIMGGERDVRHLSAEIEKERVEYFQKSKNLQDKLSELRTEIEGLKVEDRMTEYDRLYSESLLHGDDKYSTLKRRAELDVIGEAQAASLQLPIGSSADTNTSAGNARSKIALFDGL